MEIQQIKDQNQLICVCISIDYKKERQIHCAIYNQTLRLFSVCQFNDNQHFSNLESLIIQLNPKQDNTNFKIYIQLPELEEQKQKVIQKLGEQNRSNINQIKLKSKSKSNIDNILSTLLKNPLNTYYIQMKSTSNMIVLEKLILELSINNDETNSKAFDLQLLNLKLYMKLDNAAINSLQIFPKKLVKKILHTNQTLFDLLNRCKTAIGTRCLKRWMKQPLQSVEKIKIRQDFLKYFLQNPDIKAYIQQELLNVVPDLQKLFFTFYKVKSNKPTRTQMSDLIKFYKLIKGLIKYKTKLQARTLTKFEEQNLYNPITEDIDELDKPSNMIQRNISLEGKEADYYIKPHTNPNLKRLSKQKQQLRKNIDQLLQQTKRDLGINVSLIQSNSHYLLFQGLKGQVQEAIKNNKQYKSMSVKTSRYSFTSNNLSRLCSEIKKIDEQYDRQQKEVLKKMFAVVASFYEVLQRLSTYLSQLDVYTTFSSIISSQPGRWCVPEFANHIEATNIVHPCLLQCIPNNCKLKQNKTIIITGPNMGGKSTYIRTIGIGVYLTHIGFYVPAKSFKTTIIDAIITRVGASDVQLKGISTFMNQMLESACMLKCSTQNSLILIDQLGRGTSTHEGFGIAWAILQHVHTQIKPYCLFATHFHEMTKMPQQIPGVLNMFASCKILNEKIIMEYKIQEGSINKSYGIELAEMIGFPPKVIQESRKFAGQLEYFEQEISNQQRKNDKKMLIQGGSQYTISYNKKLQIIQLSNKFQQKYENNQNDKRRQQEQNILKQEIRSIIFSKQID